MALNMSTSPPQGREWLLSELQDWFESGGQRATLVGPPGIGKSYVGRAFAAAVADSVLVDFAWSRDPYQALQSVLAEIEQGQRPSLLVLDAVENAPPSLWLNSGLELDFPDIPKLFIFRPGVHYEALQQPGTQLFALDPMHPKHQEELADHLKSHGLEHLIGVLSTFGEAQFLIANPHQGGTQLDSHYLSLWRQATRSFQGNTRILMEQVALLLADTPEGLPFESVSDFTGLPLVAVREAIDLLAPILTMTPTGVTLFSRGLARYIASHFSRDLGPVHGRVVSFFRETYPSWHEMHDPYGWRYLVLHCDRLARASRRQDFSVLHWLNEGSFSALKLERTGMLPSVVKDLNLSLLASLETEDIPRIVSFGCRLARLRKQESVKTVHRLADAGNLPMARENAFLVSGEGQKLLLWLLFATQTLEAEDFASTSALLHESLAFPAAALEENEVRLAASLLAAMLAHPGFDTSAKILLGQVLSMNELPQWACVAFKTAAHSHLLTSATRLELLQRAALFAEQILDEESRRTNSKEIASRQARLQASSSPSSADSSGIAYPTRLLNSKDRDKEFAKLLAEIPKGETTISAASAALVPLDDDNWVNTAFFELLELLGTQSDEELLRHSLSGLIQSLEDSRLKDFEPRIWDTLSLAILTFENPADRSRYLARFAALLFTKGRPLEAQQKISLSAANAFSVADTATRATTLLNLASMVATTGALGRARDLAFHALELRSRVDELDRESRQLVRLLSTSTAKNDSAEEIIRLGESLRFDNSPLEIEAKGRALVALAAGLARLGADSQAKTYREKAIEATQAIDNVELRIHLLCDLAGALYQSGEKRHARKLAKEARALYDDNENLGLLPATALLRVAMVLENQAQTKKCFEICLKYLKNHHLKLWLASPALLELLSLSRPLRRTLELAEHLSEARKADDLNDEQALGLLRCELELGHFDNAELILEQIQQLQTRCQAGIDLALALLAHDPERSLQHLAHIPLEVARCEGIRRLALLNSSEIRPTEQFRVRHVLNKLTLLAVDHPDAMDSVLSRWLQGCPDHDTILAVADKMGWSTGANGLFREALQTAHSTETVEEETILPSPEAHDEPSVNGDSQQDDGFQVISLTNPKG